MRCLDVINLGDVNFCPFLEDDFVSCVLSPQRVDLALVSAQLLLVSSQLLGFLVDFGLEVFSLLIENVDEFDLQLAVVFQLQVFFGEIISLHQHFSDIGS